MKLKSVLLLSLSFMLFSCDGASNSISSTTYDESFSTDLAKLFAFNDRTKNYEDSFEFNLNSYIAPSQEYENYYIVTVEISYKDTVIEDIKIIALPFSITKDEAPLSISNIGYYSNSFTLANVVNAEEYTFTGFRISYLTNNKVDDVKVSLSGIIENTNKNYLFCIDNASLTEKSDNNYLE